MAWIIVIGCLIWLACLFPWLWLVYILIAAIAWMNE